LREGQAVGEWDMAAEVGAKAAGLKIKELLERAQSPAIEKRVREETADYHRLQVTQRPTFVFDSEIGDRAILSGFAKVEPLAAALDSMIEDCAAYESHGVHFGAPPA
jgi:predicted DsbA family dithiol-disulfide isomerase